LNHSSSKGKYSKAGLDDNAIAQWRFDSDPLGFDHAGLLLLLFF